MNQKGQLILTLILVMTVALAIGLSVVQKSLVDVSTATKVEQSSRAFSAAEAGIEKALQSVGNTSVSFSENASSADVIDTDYIPRVPTDNSRQAPLEYPPLAKEDIAHVWLADYTSTVNPPPPGYTQSTLDIYWGNSSQDPAALELTLVYYDGAYKSKKWYLDNSSADRAVDNNFEDVNCTNNYSLIGYQCRKALDFSTITSNPSVILMLVRARLLYNSTSQPFAVQAPSTATCGTACSIPPQARILVSTGVSGETQRKVKLFQLNKVVPPYFDFAIFSAGEIKK